MGINERYQSLLQGLEDIRKTLDEVRRENIQLRLEKLQWGSEKTNVQTIVAQAIAQANATNNASLEEINRLRERIRQLEEADGSIGQLGD